jgi:uncharacterized FlaG/YvyC family protein
MTSVVFRPHCQAVISQIPPKVIVHLNIADSLAQVDSISRMVNDPIVDNF